MLSKQRLVMVFTAMAIISCLCACGKKTGLEGKLVDGKGQALSGVKIVAEQFPAVPDGEHFETETGSDGKFYFSKMFPAARYVLKPMSKTWSTSVSITAESGQEGHVIPLEGPLAVRFMVRSQGCVFDSATGLEWVVGPDRDTNYQEALTWVKACTVDGGGWRMPTKDELKVLYIRDAGRMNIDPGLDLKSCCVWGEPRDKDTAWGFDFNSGRQNWNRLDNAISKRVFAVRVQKK